MNLSLRLLASIIAALFIANASTAIAQTSALVHIKVATQQNTGDAPFFIALEKGYFKEEGLDVEFEFLGNGTTIVPLLGTGQVDVATGSASPALWNAVARGIPVKIVSGLGSVSPTPKTGFSSSIWLVISKQSAATGRIKDYRDLKGKTIAVAGLGLSNDILVDHALKKGGLTRKDVRVEALDLPDMVAALTNGAIDVAAEQEPLVTEGVAKGILARWKNAAELYPGQVSSVILYSPEFVRRDPDAGARLAIALTKAVRDYNDAFGPKHLGTDQIVAILTKHTNVKDPALYGQMTWNFLDPDCRVNEASLKADLDWYVQNGYVAKEPDLNRVVDNSYCDAALKALGRY
jgi:NitT/TauT family transport system substrate-binding protein